MKRKTSFLTLEDMLNDSIDKRLSPTVFINMQETVNGLLMIPSHMSSSAFHASSTPRLWARSSKWLAAGGKASGIRWPNEFAIQNMTLGHANYMKQTNYDRAYLSHHAVFTR